MEVNCFSETIANRRNVKSSKQEIANYHEKSKDYLIDSEIKVLLEVSKKQYTQGENTLNTIRL